MSPHIEPLKTLKRAADELAFPSPHALRMFLARRPGLVGERYRRVGRSTERLLTAGEIAQIAFLTTTVSIENSPSR